MAYPPNWYIVSAYESWVNNTRHIVYGTDIPCHMYLAVSKVYRFPRRRWVWFRGVPRLHGTSRPWTTDHLLEQQEPGDTLVHTFDIVDWKFCDIRYWIAHADVDGERTPSRSCVFEAHFTGGIIPPLPEPLVEPFTWPFADARIRTGNRYTFWANSAWFIFIPTLTRLTMWRYEAGAVVRCDQEHEPLAPADGWSDADARLDNIRADIHIGVFNSRSGETENHVWYVLFDTNNRIWGAANLVATPKRYTGHKTAVSITLDADADPSFWYNHAPGAYSEIWVTIYHAGLPDPPFQALAPAWQLIQWPTAYHDLMSGLRGVATVSTVYKPWARARDALGVWSPLTKLTPDALNAAQYSMSANDGHLDLGMAGRYRDADYHRYVPPWESFPNRVPRDVYYVNAVTNVGAPNQLLLVYKDSADKLAYVYRSPDLEWHPPVAFPFAVVTDMAATHAEPDVTSCLWRNVTRNTVTFFAFYDPWAT